jgi:hypothetical protein
MNQYQPPMKLSPEKVKNLQKAQATLGQVNDMINRLTACGQDCRAEQAMAIQRAQEIAALLTHFGSTAEG